MAQSPTIPTVCYDTCNNAFLEAQRVGKTPALCASNSAFTTYYESCESCCKENGVELSEILDFSVYLDYCSAVSATPGSSTVPSSAGSTSSASSASSLQFTVLTTVRPYTEDNGGAATTWSFTAVVTLYSPVATTGVIQTTRTVNGAEEISSYTTTFAQLPSDLTTTSAPPLATMPPSSDPAGVSNSAWIAGPVVGGVAAVALAALGGFIIWRRKWKGKTNFELHGETAEKSELGATHPPQELEAPQPLHELESISSRPSRYELPADR
ncbi:hypothetical protein F5Y04DRAFT_252611 [Hypomontagnella monticulosa]|nr:hypothetical protein F5Y04DRAFT_252611 [Hypomontagnella monticulosa]